MKVLVTGSNGFIAKNFIQFLSEKAEVEILKTHRETTDQELEQSVLASDWIVHLGRGKKRKRKKIACFPV